MNKIIMLAACAAALFCTTGCSKENEYEKCLRESMKNIPELVSKRMINSAMEKFRAMSADEQKKALGLNPEDEVTVDLQAEASYSSIVQPDLQAVQFSGRVHKSDLKPIDRLGLGVDGAQLAAVGHRRLRGERAELDAVHMAMVDVEEMPLSERQFLLGVA